MADTKRSTNKSATATKALMAIEVLKHKTGVSESIYQGVCTAKGWRNGKMVTEVEFNQAIADFGGREIGKKE